MGLSFRRQEESQASILIKLEIPPGVGMTKNASISELIAYF